MLHGLRHGTGVVALAIATTALVIGSVTVIASIVMATLVHPGPYREPERVLGLQLAAPSLPYPRIYFPVDDARSLCDGVAGPGQPFAACLPLGVAYVMMTGGGEPAHLNAGVMPAETFVRLGVGPLLGRTITAGDDRPGAPAVMVIGEEVWRTSFGSDPGVVGRIVRVDGRPHEIVGVMPRSFTWGVLTAWLPLRLDLYGEVTGRFVQVAGWLQPGVTEAQASERANRALQSLEASAGGRYPDGARLTFGRPAVPLVRAEVRTGVLLLGAGVGLLALVGVVNIAALLLARATGRLQDLRIRAWLGASRLALTRDLLVEATAIAVAGACAGLAVAYAALPPLVAALPVAVLPLGAEVAIDPRVLVCLSAVTVGIILCCGAMPAWVVTRRTGDGFLRSAATGANHVAGARRIWQMLVGLEVAMATLLLVLTLVLIRGVMDLRAEPLQYSPDGVVAFGLTTSEQRYAAHADAMRFLEQTASQVRLLPGVRRATVANLATPRNHQPTPFVLSGRTPREEDRVGARIAGAEYFGLFGIPVLRGRAFTLAEEQAGVPVAVVNEAFARQFGGTGDVLGRSVRLPGLRTVTGTDAPVYDIVGVVRDVPNSAQRPGQTLPEVTVVAGTAVTGRNWFLLVQTDVEQTAEIVRPVQEAVWRLDPDQAFRSIRTEDEALWASRYGWPTFRARLLAAFGVLALLLAGAGAYGIVSYTTLRDSRDVAVRLALGLEPAAVLRLVLTRSLAPVLLGLLGGTLLAAALGTAVRSMVGRVSPWDPSAYLGATLLVFVVTVLSCYPAARRAARVDPSVVFRGGD